MMCRLCLGRSNHLSVLNFQIVELSLTSIVSGLGGLC